MVAVVARRKPGIKSLSSSSIVLTTLLCAFLLLVESSHGFVCSPLRSSRTMLVGTHADPVHSYRRLSTYYTGRIRRNMSSADGKSAYVPLERTVDVKTVREAPYPKVGDVVRYYDLDGGDAKGQILVGKIVFIQGGGKKEGNVKWSVEVVELDDVGEGYFAEFPSRERRSRKSLLDLTLVAPVPASFVRSQDAFKIPLDNNKEPKCSFEAYKIEGYEGPQSMVVDEEVLLSDGQRYDELKNTLLRDAALVGAVGTVLAQFLKGTEDAAVYFLGALAGVGYLFFLSLKTDTLGTSQMNFGKNLSNLRFVLPVIVLVGVAVANSMLGNTALNSQDGDLFHSVTSEQFGSAMVGFLTYRIPLFLRQLQPVVAASAVDLLPGSAGVALRMSQEESAKKDGKTETPTDSLTPILVVSGPPGTGKTTLVNALIARSDGAFQRPTLVDRVAVDGATFERMESRGEFLELDGTGRYGLTVDSLLENGTDGSAVTVVDADVTLAKKLTRVNGVRLVGVWVGLDSLDKFESRIKRQMEEGALKVPRDDTEESVLRAKIRETVKDIEYGVVSGIFEFTILNDDLEESIRLVQTAAQYCFK